ncbi:TrmH family RNA methyltransferase, partial [Patescibacteria group bacterium]
SFKLQSTMKQKEIILILHNIRSLHNVGSIFRTADGAGITKIYLTGYTPSPVDIFGNTRSEIKKTALGAENTVEWQKYTNISQLIKLFRSGKLQKNPNYRGSTSIVGATLIVGVEQDERAVDYRKFRPDSLTGGAKRPLALILGNEVRGLSKQILNKCDKIIEIPMYGKKESLNVAVTAGIILFELI